ncbi:MAG: histidine kinase [Lapillicoccus sp.]
MSEVTRDSPGARARAAEFFAVDDDWVRHPAPDAGRRDVLLALILFAISALTFELARSGGAITTGHPVWQEYAGLVAVAAPVGIRRRWPLVCALLASVAFFVVGVTMPDIALLLPVQVLYFYALFSAMAWASDRRAALVVMGVVLLVMFGWLSWQFIIGRAAEELSGMAQVGPISPVVAGITYTFLVNVFYFGGAVLGGQAAWRAARRRAELADQARILRTQAAELREHAVVQERLRIARELHDVVAHHVSVMGVQAGAARRVLAADPAAASAALSSVEGAARQAVTEMRALLGTLRQGEPHDDGPVRNRAPEPSVDALPELVETFRAEGLDVAYTVVAEPVGAAERVSPAVGLTLYRTVQESLTNVRRHSTASSATVVLRVVEPRGGESYESSRGYAEVEVLDSGRPRTGTSGTGLGLLGMRERVASLDGSLEIGPRATGGFRVRVRTPLPTVDGALAGRREAGR